MAEVVLEAGYLAWNRGLDKSEVYEIIREKSRILELKFAEGRISEAPFVDNHLK